MAEHTKGFVSQLPVHDGDGYSGWLQRFARSPGEPVMGRFIPPEHFEEDLRDFDLIERGFFAEPEEADLPTFFEAIENPQLIERFA